MNLRNKSKNLKETLLRGDEEKKSKKGGGGDKRFLNYFNLEDGEKMTIRLLPDGGDSGEYWSEYAMHSIKTKGVDSIRCSYEANGDSCDVCNHSYQFHLDGDKGNNTRWMAKSKFLAQCIVIDAPFDINGHDDDDENIVKLFSMPYGIYQIIKEAVIEDQIGEIMDTDFIIKNVKGKNGYNNYDRSYFAKKEDPLSDEIIDAFDNGDLELFDLVAETPNATTSDDMTEWLDNAIAVESKTSRPSTTGASDDDESVNDSDDKGEETSTKKSSASSLLERLKKKDKNK